VSVPGRHLQLQIAMARADKRLTALRQRMASMNLSMSKCKGAHVCVCGCIRRKIPNLPEGDAWAKCVLVHYHSVQWSVAAVGFVVQYSLKVQIAALLGSCSFLQVFRACCMAASWKLRT
jgi:hypothetical protein